MTVAKSRQLLRLLLQGKPELVSISEKLDKCLNCSKKYDISGYDSAYVVLAKESGLVLVSADEKLVAKVGDQEIAMTLEQFTGARKPS